MAGYMHATIIPESALGLVKTCCLIASHWLVFLDQTIFQVTYFKTQLYLLTHFQRAFLHTPIVS